MHVTGCRQKLRILLGTAEGKKLHGRPRIDGRNMVEGILKTANEKDWEHLVQWSDHANEVNVSHV